MVANNNEVQLCYGNQIYEAQSYETSVGDRRANWMLPSPELN